MLTILTTVLLYFKAELQTLTRQLTRRDLISILQFGVLSLVVILMANLVFKLGIVYTVAGRHLGHTIALGFAAIACGCTGVRIFQA